jgi:hypothetical protein
LHLEEIVDGFANLDRVVTVLFVKPAVNDQIIDDFRVEQNVDRHVGV